MTASPTSKSQVPGSSQPIARIAAKLDASGHADLAEQLASYRFGLHTFQPVVREARVFAWLPGFRDPREAVPDDVYDISDLVGVQAGADEAHWFAGEAGVVAGWAFLEQLSADADDVVTVVFTPKAGQPVRFPAQRERRGDLTRAEPARLVRRAYTGFRAQVDGARLQGPGTFEVEVAQGPIVRRVPLVAAKGSELQAALPVTIDVRAGRRARFALQAGRKGQLVVGPRANAASLARRAERKARRAVRKARRVAGSARRRR